MKKNQKVIYPKGIYPTMITPFTEKGEVDYKGIIKLTDWYWRKGCDGIFAVCQSSELFFLSLEERVGIAQTVTKRSKELASIDISRKPMTIVVSGHKSENFSEQVKELTAMSETGADAVVLITNRMDIMNKSEEQWIADLKRLLAELPDNVPYGLYECPKPYKRLISENMLRACIDTGRFVFMKDTCCDAQEIKRRCQVLAGSGIALLNANAQTLLQTLRYGCAGYCGVMANFHPELYQWIYQHQGESPLTEKVQAFIGLAAFTECLAYPATAKYYLKKYENIDIIPYSRSVDCRRINDYQMSCLWQMKLLTDCILREIEDNFFRHNSNQQQYPQ